MLLAQGAVRNMMLCLMHSVTITVFAFIINFTCCGAGRGSPACFLPNVFAVSRKSYVSNFFTNFAGIDLKSVNCAARLGNNS